jgi:hypothetical protein
MEDEDQSDPCKFDEVIQNEMSRYCRIVKYKSDDESLSVFMMLNPEAMIYKYYTSEPFFAGNHFCKTFTP